MSYGISSAFAITKSAKQKEIEKRQIRIEKISFLNHELDKIEWDLNWFSHNTAYQQSNLAIKREEIINELQELNVTVAMNSSKNE